MQHPPPRDVSDPVIDIGERQVGSARERGSVTAARADVDATVETAFLLHADRLTSFAIAATHDRDAADDMVGETFLRLLREVRAGRTPDNVGAWLYRVCGNQIASRGRRISVARRALDLLLDRGQADSPETMAIRHDHDQHTVSALRQLQPDARVALLMAAQGHDMATIAHAIGRTPNATRTFVCRSRVHLRDLLRVVEPDEVGR